MTRRAIALWIPAAATLFLIGVAVVAGMFRDRWMGASAASTSVLTVQPTSNVVLAVRDLARLESTSYHMEKVIELTDQQTHLFGLVQAKDAILLIAEAEVVAGVDLSKVPDKDIRVDPTDGSVHMRLPAPEIFSLSLDETHTRVYQRTTDTLANRNDKLEGLARQQAEAEMRKGAIDGGILDRARTSAERTVRGLVRAMGYTRIDVQWQSGPALPVGEPSASAAAH